jgi:putative transposase
VNCYPFIEAEKAQRRNVKRACELLKVSRSAYYAARGDEPSDRARQDAELAARVRAAHRESKGRYGSPRVRAQLRAQGLRHSRKRVARLMRAQGLQGRAAKRWKKTTIPGPAAARADRIRRDFTAGASRLSTRWCGDITYIATWEGWPYLATVIDIASRRVVGFALADHLRTELIAGALSNAVAARDPEPGVIFHSGRGCQYTSAAHAALADECEVALSVGRTASAGTTRWPSRSSPRSRASSSTPAPGRPGPAPGGRSWSTSAGTTAPVCTAPSASSRQLKPTATHRIQSTSPSSGSAGSRSSADSPTSTTPPPNCHRTPRILFPGPTGSRGAAAGWLWGFCGDLEDRGRCLRHRDRLSSCHMRR